MAFCFPGYNAKGADLPPPPICAKTWHGQVMDCLSEVKLTLLVGGYSQKRYLGSRASGTVTQTVTEWRTHFPETIPLPHPSWRNNGWIRKNPWFEADLLPALQSRVAQILG